MDHLSLPYGAHRMASWTIAGQTLLDNPILMLCAVNGEIEGSDISCLKRFKSRSRSPAANETLADKPKRPSDVLHTPEALPPLRNQQQAS